MRGVPGEVQTPRCGKCYITGVCSGSCRDSHDDWIEANPAPPEKGEDHDGTGTLQGGGS